jgi:hypothetical protein
VRVGFYNHQNPRVRSGRREKLREMVEFALRGFGILRDFSNQVYSHGRYKKGTTAEEKSG